MAEQFQCAGIAAVAISGDSAVKSGTGAARSRRPGSVQVVFTVDLFNEGVDVPTVDTLLLLRPTDSPTLFLQQLGRVCARRSKAAVHGPRLRRAITARSFGYDRRFRALLGGSRSRRSRSGRAGFPFLPAGAASSSTPSRRTIVLRSIRNAIPADWRATSAPSFESMGDVGLGRYLNETGLDLETSTRATGAGPRDATCGSVCPLRRPAQTRTRSCAPSADCSMSTTTNGSMPTGRFSPTRGPQIPELAPSDRTSAHVDAGRASPTTLGRQHHSKLDGLVAELWAHPQVRSELVELFAVLADRVTICIPARSGSRRPARGSCPLHANEILAAFDIGTGAERAARIGEKACAVLETADTDLFAFTLDKTSGGFSPTTRYRGLCDQPHAHPLGELSRRPRPTARPASATSTTPERGTKIVLFAR